MSVGTATPTVDWRALEPAELGVLLEHAAARLRGQAAPPLDGDGHVFTTATWDALPEAEREHLITAMIVELRRKGLDRSFPRRAPTATHSHRPANLAVGNKTGAVMNETTGALEQATERIKQVVERLKQVLGPARPAARDVALFYEPDGSAIRALPLARTEDLKFAEPVPYFTQQAEGDGASRGVPEVERRRREQELQGRLTRARKRAAGAPVADRERWATEIQRLEDELRAWAEPRDRERRRQGSVTG